MIDTLPIESFSPFGIPESVLLYILPIVIVWSIFWKGWALWRAARNGQKYWFGAVLVVNTLGILEILYIFIFSRQQKDTTSLTSTTPPSPSDTKDGKISFEKFRETDLRVVRIKNAERVSGSDKLVRIDLDDGNSSRQIVAGVGKKYDPQELIGKEIVIVANLEPRKLMGLESQGMLLAATNTEGNPILIVPLEEVAPGSRLS
ncbi:MAG: methionine--tRNA ligase subunit beta [Anaplasmataceae bacterium]|nr:methionine--tRNA ligase subunit beta [Anaplasmataceae bacterium]